MSGFVTTCRTGWPARSARPTASLCPGLQTRWIGRRHGRRQDRRWASSWSPEQIANRLPVEFPDDESMRISHEAIYQALYIQGRGALKRELVACLRTGRALRVPRARTRAAGKDVRHTRDPDQRAPGRGRGPGSARALGRRPDPRVRQFGDRHPGRAQHPVHDAAAPAPHGRHGGLRVKNGPPLAGHGAQAVRDAIASAITTLPEQLRRSLTWDRGKEMAQHAQLRIDTGVRSTSATPTVRGSPGSEARTRTLMGCCANTSRKAPTSRDIQLLNSVSHWRRS